MGGYGSGRSEWTEDEKEAKRKPQGQKRKPKTLSFYEEDIETLRRSAERLGISESEYVRVLISRNGSETLTNFALQLETFHRVQQGKIEKLELFLEELKIEQANLSRILKRLGIYLKN